MFKLFHKKLNKKGFTLAELLIVVAIIAILVAIAVPIFTSSLAKAEEAVKNAQIRAVRGEAVVAILDDWDTFGGTDIKGWTVEATVDPSGNTTAMTITPSTTAVSGTSTATRAKDTGIWTVTVYITELPTPTKGGT